MIWEGRPLREDPEADIKVSVESGFKEHPPLKLQNANSLKITIPAEREFVLDIEISRTPLGTFY